MGYKRTDIIFLKLSIMPLSISTLGFKKDKTIRKTILSEYQKDEKLEYSIKHVDGSVRFDNLETALETFLNFHSKGYFNNRPECVRIFREMERDILPYKLPTGEIELGAGFLLIDILKK